MKFIHLGDIHLGKNVNEFSMIEDQKYILHEIINLIKRESVDAVLIAGDIYDRSIPSEEAVKLFDFFLTTMAEMGRKVFAIAGNHDSEERLHFGSKLFQVNHIYISGHYDGKIECVDVEDEYGVIHIWLLPYVKASRVAHFYPDEVNMKEGNTYNKAFKTAIEKCNLDKSHRNLILTHQFVVGKSEEPELAGSENAMLSVGTIDQISFECFDGFDYVAMGHIHSAQMVGRETCRYAGSPLKYSLNQREIAKEKTVPIITMSEKGNVKVECFPLKPLREVRRIKGNLKDLIENAVDTEDYIYATLTDEVTQFNAMARLQEVYPNTMKLDYDNHSTRAIKEFEGELETEGKGFHELMLDFYKLMNGTEPSEEEWNILKEVAEEAGIIE